MGQLFAEVVVPSIPCIPFKGPPDLFLTRDVEIVIPLVPSNHYAPPGAMGAPGNSLGAPTGPWGFLGAFKNP